MKISFTTLGCPDWSFEKILSEAKRMGYNGIEVRGIEGEMRAEKMPQFFPENAEKTKAMIKEHGLVLSGFGTSVNFHDDDNYENALEEGRQAIDVCVRMGIPRIRVFGDKIPSEDVKAHTIDNVAKGLRILCEYARGKGVDVLLEIHGDFKSAEVVLPVIEKVKDCPEFGILWDVMNNVGVFDGGWRKFYEAIKPWVRHTHFKDGKPKNGSIEYALIGEGDVPIGEICTELKKNGYTGWYSLEWEKKWHPELEEPEIAFPAFMELIKKFV